MKRISPIFEDFQNPYKVFHHLDRVKELKDNGDTTPIHITVGLTNFCNHTCSWCYINWNQSGQQNKRSGTDRPAPKPIQADYKIVEALKEAKELGLKAVTIVGDGEPTLHKQFVNIINDIKALDIDIGVFSNMSFKKKEVFDCFLKNLFYVRGSIDACNKETHKKSHGLDDFDLVINNIKELLDKRGSNPFPVIGVQYVCNQWNYREVVEAAEFYKSIGVDYITYKPMYKNELNPAHEENSLNNEDVIPLLIEAKKLESENFKIYGKQSQFKEVLGNKYNNGVYYKKCNATPLSPYMDEDGSVELCGNLKGRGFKLGNIYEQSFKEIWSSEHRKKIINKIDLCKCPAGCKLDPLNKVLWDAFEPDENNLHPNFIG